jgi:hypothetical protein
MGRVSGDSIFKKQLANGTPVKVLVQSVSEEMGLGGFAAQDIEAGQAVCEYVGEIITYKEFLAREPMYTKSGLFYSIEPRKLNPKMKRWVIDATKKVTTCSSFTHALYGSSSVSATAEHQQPWLPEDQRTHFFNFFAVLRFPSLALCAGIHSFTSSPSRGVQGNVSRFINHACGASVNLVARYFAADHSLSWEDKVSHFPYLHVTEFDILVASS